jgi:S1-C subfamily serine protease
MYLLFSILLFAFQAMPIFSGNEKANTIQKSLLQIKVTTQAPNFQFPWVPKKPNLSEINGIFVGNGKILVLASQIEYATSIEVRKFSSHSTEPALVKKIDFEANLAILMVGNSSFLDDLIPIGFEDKLDPETDTGFMQLDNSGSAQTARGRITGIDMDTFPLSHIELPYLNVISNEKLEGNGELVTEKGKHLGILYRFQSNKNTGRAIPGFIINQFLEHKKKGSAFPYMGFKYKAIVDKSTKDYYGLTQTGVMVVEITPYSGAEKVLKLEDIILEAGEFAVDSQGFFQHPDVQYGKQALSFLFHAGKEIGYKKGDKIKLKILRNKKEMIVTLPLKSFPYKALAIPHAHHYNRNPNYTIIGGFIFTELSEFLLREWGMNWRSKVDKKLLYLLDFKKFHESGQTGKIIILVQVLPDDSNNGYHNISMEIVDSANGTKIKSIKHLHKIIESTKGEIAQINLQNRVTIGIDKINLETINEKISKKFNIPNLYFFK